MRSFLLPPHLSSLLGLALNFYLSRNRSRRRIPLYDSVGVRERDIDIWQPVDSVVASFPTGRDLLDSLGAAIQGDSETRRHRIATFLLDTHANTLRNQGEAVRA